MTKTNYSKILLPFGKYKGQDLVTLSRHNSNYLIWLSKWDGLQEPFKTALLKFLKTKTFKDNQYFCDLDYLLDDGLYPGTDGWGDFGE